MTGDDLRNISSKLGTGLIRCPKINQLPTAGATFGRLFSSQNRCLPKRFTQICSFSEQRCARVFPPKKHLNISEAKFWSIQTVVFGLSLGISHRAFSNARYADYVARTYPADQTMEDSAREENLRLAAEKRSCFTCPGEPGSKSGTPGWSNLWWLGDGWWIYPLHSYHNAICLVMIDKLPSTNLWDGGGWWPRWQISSIPRQPCIDFHWMIYVFFAHGLFMVVSHFFQKLRHPRLGGHPKNLLLYHFRNRSCDLGIFFGTPHVQRHPHIHICGDLNPWAPLHSRPRESFFHNILFACGFL